MKLYQCRVIEEPETAAEEVLDAAVLFADRQKAIDSTMAALRALYPSSGPRMCEPTTSDNGLELIRFELDEEDAWVVGVIYESEVN